MATGGTVTGADPSGGEARRPGDAVGRFRLALTLNLLAAAVALLVGLWFLSYQRLTLAYPQFSSNFYDAQARSWLRGRWAIPPRVLGLEGIRSDTGMQMYFGPFPSLFRLPFVLFTRRLDGRLSQPSLFLAYATYLAAISWIWWQVRAMFRAGRPIGRGDAILSAATTLTLGVGTLFVTLLTSTTVYFEAIAWGVALTLK